MDKKILSYVAACGLLLGVASGSQASLVVIDFESAPANYSSYTASGVTFTGVSSGTISTVTTPNGTLGQLVDSNPREEMRADIAGGTNAVSIDIGDNNADPDTLFIEAYNALDAVVDFASLLIDSSFVGMKTLSVSGDIAYVIYGARSPATNGSSVYADNFTYNKVPEPASLALLGFGLAVLAATRRRKQ